MTLQGIKDAVEGGETVYWDNPAFRVVKDDTGKWMIVRASGVAFSLTDENGVTLGGYPEHFYIAGQQENDND